MRLIVQRVSEASCTIDGNITGKIDTGFMVLVGIGLDDNEDIVIKMANKLSKLRVFEDSNGKMNLGLRDVNGAILSISQFTLYADCTKGNRPSFNLARRGDEAIKLYDLFNKTLRDLGFKVETGVFGTDMKISLLNDGPVTIIMDSRELV